jgi:hypothetical protein
MATTIETERPEVMQVLANETECPRCFGMMTLYADFDDLFYSCEECDFILHAIANKGA